MWKKLILSIVSIFFVGLVGGHECVGAEFVELSGKPLFSFTPKHYIFQTGPYIYKINKENLSARAARVLEAASIQGKDITLSLPRRSIEYAWPNQSVGLAETASDTFKNMAARLSHHARTHGGDIELRGKQVYSFSEAFFLVQVGDAVYQIKKAALEVRQFSLFSETAPGGNIELTVPQAAVNLVWNFKQSGVKNTSSVRHEDKVNMGGTSIALTGIVLCSFDEPLVLVQSEGVIYKIRKNQITTSDRRILDSPGARIELKAPIEAIEFAWSVEPSNLEIKRVVSGLSL